MVQRVGRLNFIPLHGTNVAIVNIDKNTDQHWTVDLNGSDSSGDVTVPVHMVVDNLGNSEEVIISYDLFSFSVPPFTRTNFDLANGVQNVSFFIVDGNVQVIFSDKPIGVPDTQDQNASSGNVGTYIRKDGSVPFVSDVSLGGFHINNLADPVSATDAANKEYVDSAIGVISVNYSKLDGSTPYTANVSFSGFNITNLANPVNAQDAATKFYCDRGIFPNGFITCRPVGKGGEGGQLILAYHTQNAIVGSDVGTWNLDVDATDNFRLFNVYMDGTVRIILSVDNASGNVLFSGTNLKNIANPVDAQDAATKNYIDIYKQALVSNTGVSLIGGAMPDHSSTFVNAPNLVVPANNKTIVLCGAIAPNDTGGGTYFNIGNVQPTHDGWFKLGNNYYELQPNPDQSVTPWQFKRLGDVDDADSFIRAIKYMNLKNIHVLRLASLYYDIRSKQVSINGDMSIIGNGFSETGFVAGYTDNFKQYGNQCFGSWIIAGNLNFSNILVTGSARGGKIDRIGFAQPHPTVVTGQAWTPTNYTYVIEINNINGGYNIGDIIGLPINRFIRCTLSGRLHIERIRGHIFSEALNLDGAYDVVTVGKVHFYPFASFANEVTTYVQANCQLFTIFRCDGLYISDWFCIGIHVAIYFGNSQYGFCSDFKINKMYVDGSVYGLYFDCAGVFGTIDSFTHQAENLVEAKGLPYAGSASIAFSGNANSCYVALGWGRHERTQYCVNDLNKTNQVYYASPPYLRYNNNNPAFKTGAKNVVVSAAPNSDAQSSNLGTLGVDYIITDTTFKVTGDAKVDANGNILFAHGLGANWQGLRGRAFCTVKLAAGNHTIGNFSSIDGTNINFTTSASYSGQPARWSLEVDRYTPAAL